MESLKQNTQPDPIFSRTRKEILSFSLYVSVGLCLATFIVNSPAPTLPYSALKLFFAKQLSPVMSVEE